MIAGDDVFINGDGETSRDFCFIENTVQANILAAQPLMRRKNQVYNVAVGDRTTLNDLYAAIQVALFENSINYAKSAVYREFRAGDVRHSQSQYCQNSTGFGICA